MESVESSNESEDEKDDPKKTKTQKKKSSSSRKKTIQDCKICFKTFRKQEVYLGHMILKHPNSIEVSDLDLDRILKHVCQHCGTKFASKSALKNHEKRHVEKTRYKCDFEGCTSTFSIKQSLVVHYKTHTGERELCCHCGKAFTQKGALRRHIQVIHNEEKPYKCSFENCNAAFSRKNSLNVHCVEHTGKYPFTCTLCNKGFKLKDSLTVHFKTHTGEKELCPHCGEGFSQKSALRRHIKTIHEQLKPFKCSYDGCSAAFSRDVYLKEHMVVHTGQYLFSCPQCLKGFRQKGSLKSHLENNHCHGPQGENTRGGNKQRPKQPKQKKSDKVASNMNSNNTSYEGPTSDLRSVNQGTYPYFPQPGIATLGPFWGSG